MLQKRKKKSTGCSTQAQLCGPDLKRQQWFHFCSAKPIWAHLAGSPLGTTPLHTWQLWVQVFSRRWRQSFCSLLHSRVEEARLKEKGGITCQECREMHLQLFCTGNASVNIRYIVYLQCKGVSWWQEATSPLSCEPTLLLHSDCRVGPYNSWNLHSH